MYNDEYTGEWRWEWWSQFVGVSLAVLLVYFVGLLVGNLIGRTFWKLGESLALKIPVVRAIYPGREAGDRFPAAGPARGGV
jgi:uncharacterized membrane protein